MPPLSWFIFHSSVQCIILFSVWKLVVMVIIASDRQVFPTLWWQGKCPDAPARACCEGAGGGVGMLWVARILLHEDMTGSSACWEWVGLQETRTQNANSFSLLFFLECFEEHSQSGHVQHEDDPPHIEIVPNTLSMSCSTLLMFSSSIVSILFSDQTQNH